jgi:hypothetical protein
MRVVAVPQAVLSEHFQERMKGRRLKSAVFLTYQLDPGFFELEVLPVFLDLALSHAAPIKHVQLEQALVGLRVAVYYDANGLVPSDSGSARLDVRRIPVRHRTGIFHPKNVFALVESKEADADGYHAKALLVASLSANLTRSGWWENVEACHVEEIEEGTRTRLKDDLASFLESVARRTQGDREAIRDVLRFLRSTEQRRARTRSEVLHPHFYAGGQSVADFLDAMAGPQLRGCCLEVISPFFDDAGDCGPLRELVERFDPTETRVFLPRSNAGEALVRPDLYEAVRSMPDVSWARLPKDATRLSHREDAGHRYVHAKVYRFFSQRPKREICFIGSANLTSAGHSAGGNVETGFLVECPTPRAPEFWLQPDSRRPTEFCAQKEGDDTATGRATRLDLRYDWAHARAEAWWNDSKPSPSLHVLARGVEIVSFHGLAPREWVRLSADDSARVQQALSETSLFQVIGDLEREALLLVQEEGMAKKPSLLLQLSTAEILQYWSLLTPEQRNAFIETRAPELALTVEGAELMTRAKIALEQETLFQRFAGYFHAFGLLERDVRAALDDENLPHADYRVFGKKYDSLGTLLDRLRGDQAMDAVDRYVVVLCARQLCDALRKDYPDYWKNSAEHVLELERNLTEASAIRAELVRRNGGEFETFLAWLEPWFLRRAEPMEAPA